MEQCVFREDSINVLSPLSQYHPTDRVENCVREAGKVIQVAKKQLWIKSQKRQPMRSLHLIFIRRRRCFLPKKSQKTGPWMPINCLCGWPWDLITSEGLSTPTAGKDLVGWNEHLKSNQHEEQDTWGFTSCKWAAGSFGGLPLDFVQFSQPFVPFRVVCKWLPLQPVWALRLSWVLKASKKHPNVLFWILFCYRVAPIDANNSFRYHR